MEYRIKTPTKVLANVLILSINVFVTVFFRLALNISAASIVPVGILIIMLLVTYLYSRYPEHEEIHFHLDEALAFMNKEIKIAIYHITSDVAICLFSFQVYFVFFYPDILKVILSVFVFFLIFIVGNVTSHIKLKSAMKEIIESEQDELKKQNLKEELGIK